jgi:uncharacterized protein YqhQ
MAPFTSEEIAYFNHQLTTDQVEKYIKIHKYLLTIFIFVFISIVVFLFFQYSV